MIYKNITDLNTVILQASQGDGIVDLNKASIYVDKEIKIIDHVTVRNGRIRFTGNEATITLRGRQPVLDNITIDAASTSSIRGIIEFINTTDAKLNLVTITGDTDRKAIFCKTAATDTRLENVTVTGNIGWGVLFNDAVSEQSDKNYRFVEGRDYSTIAIGSGLYVTNFKFENGVNSLKTGDGFEINCPDHGFSNIKINGISIKNTKKSSSNGIGIGFARCSNVCIDQIYIESSASDAIHFEKGAHHKITNFELVNCDRALMASHTDDTQYIGGTCLNSGSWIISYSDREGEKYPPSRSMLFENIIFDGAKRRGFLISNTSDSIFRNITCKNYNGNESMPIILFYKVNAIVSPVTDSLLDTIYFVRGSSLKNPPYLIFFEKGGLRNKIINIDQSQYPEGKIFIDPTNN